MPNYTLEKIDQNRFKKMDTRQDVTILNVKDLQNQKAEYEAEVIRLNNELAKIEEILTEYNKLP